MGKIHLTFMALMALMAGLILAGVCVLSGEAYAQQSMTSATRSGHIEDANGAAINGATLTVTQLERNQTFTATSNREGYFRFLYLPVGRCQLTAEAAGF